MFEIRKAITTYKKSVRFWVIFIAVVLCGLLVGLQFGIMYAFQSQNTIWEGVCKGGNLIKGTNDTILMTVHCPTQDKFLVNNFLITLASKNENKMFYCRKTEGNIMKNEKWKCQLSKGAK